MKWDGRVDGSPNSILAGLVEAEKARIRLSQKFAARLLHRRLRSRRVSGEFFAIVPAELEAAIRETRELLADLVASQKEVRRLAEEESDGLVLKPGSAEWSLYQNLLEVREAQDHYAFQRELLENKLKLTIGHAEGLEGIAMWKTQERRQFDEASFRLERPEMFQTYVKSPRLRVFRLTAGSVRDC